MGKRPFCVKGGEIIGNVPTIEELASYIKDYILNEGYGLAWANDDVKGASRQAIYNMHQQVVGQLEYKGLWDASSGDYPNDPELGWYYVVSVAGDVGGVYYRIGDWIIWNGTNWDKLAGKADVYPIGAQFNYYGTGVKGNIQERDYEISVANGDDFDMKGWFVANGYAGTPNCIDRFAFSTVVSGGVGGSHHAVVVEHTHQLKGFMRSKGSEAVEFMPNIGGTSEDGYIVSTGVSGVNANMPKYIGSIPVIKVG